MIFNFQGKRVLFVEPPKNATTSVRKWFIEHGEVNELLDNQLQRHYAFADIVNVLSDAEFDFVFSITRHPLDRLVSEYKYMQLLANDPSDAVKNDLHTRLCKDAITNSPTLSDFIDNHLAGNKVDKFPVTYLKEKSQTTMLLGRDGSCISPKIHILHFEQLAKEFKDFISLMTDQYGDAELPHYNSTERSKDWREYYNDRSIRIASEFYKNDLANFGYEEN